MGRGEVAMRRWGGDLTTQRNVHISGDNWEFTVKITLRSRSHSARPEATVGLTAYEASGSLKLYLLENQIFGFQK